MPFDRTKGLELGKSFSIRNCTKEDFTDIGAGEALE